MTQTPTYPPGTALRLAAALLAAVLVAACGGTATKPEPEPVEPPVVVEPEPDAVDLQLPSSNHDAAFREVERALDMAPSDVFAHRIDPLSVTEVTRTADGWSIGAINHRP